MIKKLTTALLLLSMAVAVSAQSTSATYNRVTIKDSIRFRGVWYKVWPTGGGGGTVIDTGSSSNFWRTNGNAIGAGGFIGTTNSQHLVLKQNSQQVALFKPGIAADITEMYLGNSKANLFLGGSVTGIGQSNITAPGTLDIKGTNRTFFRSDAFAFMGSNDTVFLQSGRIILAADTGLTGVSTTKGLIVKFLPFATNGTNYLLTLDSATGRVRKTSATLSSFATAGQYWATGGNASPATTDFRLGSLTADDVQFVTGTGGLEVMRLTKTGGVGVRTTSPSSSFDVGGSFGTNIITHYLPDGATFIINPQVSAADGAMTYIFDYDGGTGDGTVQLPSPVNTKGRLIVIKRTRSSSTMDFKVVSTGGEVIEEPGGLYVSTLVVAPLSVYWYQSDGTYWRLIFFR